MGNLKTASVLAFERKINPSDALMYSGNWSDKDSEKWNPIAIQAKDVRGTISNRFNKEKDPLKLNAEVQNANLQNVDYAALPHDADTLKLSYSVKILPGISKPCACNDADYQKVLEDKIESYIVDQKCEELSIRYAINIANGRSLWRNRIGADKIEIVVTDQNDHRYVFDALQFDLFKFENNDAQIKHLAEVIRKGLTGENYALLKIEIFARIGSGQEVYPSQELALDADRKVLFSIRGIAAMHSQKIGNALRTIDSWHAQSSESGPIAVEPYGSVTNRGIAYRQPKFNKDFYSLFDGWILKDKDLSIEEKHYVIACLIRGGVYGDGKK